MNENTVPVCSDYDCNEDSEGFYNVKNTGFVRKLFPEEEIPDYISNDYSWGSGKFEYGFYSLHGLIAFVCDDRDTLISILKDKGFVVLELN